jgi:hypothetical protein
VYWRREGIFRSKREFFNLRRRGVERQRDKEMREN